MSHYQNFPSGEDANTSDIPRERDLPVKLKLRICLFAEDKQLISAVEKSLDAESYSVVIVESIEELLGLTEGNEEKIDCLFLTDKPASRSILSQLQKLGILLPIAIASWDKNSILENTTLYHPAEVKFELGESEKISTKINLALTKFLNLTPHSKEELEIAKSITKESAETSHIITLQQRRLTDKLKERLGYLGVYYKRNSRDFYRNLKPEAQKKFLKKQ